VNKKRILIYDDQLSGHHLEYLHHLYEGASECKEIEFIFVLPCVFKELKNKFIWKKTENIKFHLIKNEELKISHGSLLNSYQKSKLVKKIALQNSINEVFFVTLIGFLPAISFVLPKRIQISGIIYLIYLYRFKNSSLFLKLQDITKYFLLSKINNFKSVFLLNDKSAPLYLNKKFNTSKFTYLTDPYLPIDEIKTINIREKYNITFTNTVYLHFGGLTMRKGTLKILEAISIIDEDALRNKTFIFAGKIYDDIKDDFYLKLGELKNKVQILCFDEFCEYDFLGSLCLSSDFILLPYSNVTQSSGIIGYGAQFKTPVVVPNSGLLGKLVKKYKLGYSVDLSTSKSIAEFILNNSLNHMKGNIDSKYLEDHQKKQFINQILNEL